MKRLAVALILTVSLASAAAEQPRLQTTCVQPAIHYTYRGAFWRASDGRITITSCRAHQSGRRCAEVFMTAKEALGFYRWMTLIYSDFQSFDPCFMCGETP